VTSYIAAVDCGTTGAKAIIFDQEGRRHGEAYAEYPCEFPRPLWVEQDAELLFEACCKVLAECIGGSGLDAAHIAALSFSTQRCTLIPVDERCRPLRPAISWQDNRSDSQCDFIRDVIGEEEFYAVSGLPIANVWALPSILWIRDNEPYIYQSTHKFMHPHGFLLRRFGSDDFVEDWSNASLHGLMSITDFAWSPRFLQATGVSEQKLPRLVQSGQVVGTVTEAVAARTGLAAGTVLVAGGGDQQCAAIGAGVIRDGLCEITLGTAGVTICSFDKPAFDPDRRIAVELHAYPGKWVCEGLQSTAGAALKWLRNVARDGARGQEIEYSLFNKLAADSQPGANGVIFLPYLAGAGAPQWNGEAKGVFFGLTQGDGLGVLARAVMEGVVYQNAQVLDKFEKAGQRLTDIRLTGGGARSPVWSQVQADIYGKTVNRLAEDEAALLGAAILAGVGAGLFPSIEVGVDSMVKIAESYFPNRANEGVYRKGLSDFIKLYEVLASGGLFKSA
jgi:xylulokinase